MLTRNWMFSVMIFCSLILLLGTGCNLPEAPGDGDVDNSKGPVLPAPQFSEPAGKHRKDIKVYLTHPSAGAQIRFTTDGSDPLTGGVVYTPGTPIPITRDNDMTIKAYAVIAGKSSPVVSAGYIVTGKVRIDTTEKYTGKDGKKRVFVTLDPPRAKMRYTQDGTDPTPEHGNLYSYKTGGSPDDFAIIIDKPDSLKFLAFLPDWDNSDIETVKSIDLKVKKPVFRDIDPSTGYFEYNHRVKIICQTPGAMIRYTDVPSAVINTPTDGNAYGDTVFYLTKPVTYTARAFLDKWLPSDQVTQSYNVRLPAPIFSPPQDLSVTHSTAIDLKMNSLVKEATIFYTLDGTDPTPASNTALPIKLKNSTVVKAIAYLPASTGWIQSEVATAQYNFGVDLPEPNYSTGEYFEPIKITITNAVNPNIRYFYTINGADPDPYNPTAPGQFEYDSAAGGFTINEPAPLAGVPNHMADKDTGVALLKIRAGLFEAGTVKDTSDILPREYTFKVNPPQGNPPGSTRNEPFSFNLSSTAEPPFTIYYTKDGSNPSLGTSSTRKSIVIKAKSETGQVDIDQPCLFQAVATKDHWADSDIVKGLYSLVPSPPRFKNGGYLIPKDKVLITYNSEQNFQLRAFPVSASIYFTLDGSNPADSPTRKPFNKTEPIPVNKSLTIKACTDVAEWKTTSEIVELKVNLKCEPPNMSQLDEFNNVILTCKDTGGFKIIYTTDGSYPEKTNPNAYDFGTPGTIPITKNTTVKACVDKPGWEPSEVITGTFEAKIQTPYFTDKNGLAPAEEYDAATKTRTFTYVLANVPLETDPNPVELEIGCDTNSVFIHYLRDTVADPTETSPEYDKLVEEDRIIITKPNSFVKAIGVDPRNPKQYIDSDVAKAIVKFKVMPVTFQLNPANGSTQKENKLSLLCETTGSTIYYTKTEASLLDADGNPIPGVAILYEDPIPLKHKKVETIKAVAVKAEWVSSEVTSKTFGKCEEPTLKMAYYQPNPPVAFYYYYVSITTVHTQETVVFDGTPAVSGEWILLGTSTPTAKNYVIMRNNHVSYKGIFDPNDPSLPFEKLPSKP